MDNRAAFPDESFSAMSTSDPAVTQYAQGVVVFTMGAGVLLAILACIVFNFCLLVNCCRRPNSACGACRDKDYHGPSEKCCGKSCCEKGRGIHYPSPEADQLYANPGQRFTEEPNLYKVKRTGILFIGLFLIFVGHIIFAGVTYNYGKVVDVAVVDSVDNTIDLLTGFANMICSDVDPQTSCESGSVGAALLTVETTTTDGFDLAVSLIDTVGDVADSVNAYAANIADIDDQSTTVMNNLDYPSGPLPTACTSYSSAYTDATDASSNYGADLSTLLADAAFANLPCDSSDLSDDSAYSIMLNVAAGLANTGAQAMNDTLQQNVVSILGSVSTDLGPSGSTRSDIIDSIQGYYGNTQDAADSMLDMHSSVDGNGPIVETYMDLKTKAFAAFTVLPAIFLLYHTLGEAFCASKACNECCYKGVGGCLRCHNCAIYFTNFIFCIIAGISMLLSVFVYDFCGNFDSIVVNNLSGTVTVVNETLTLSTSLMNILNCEHGQSLVDVLGVQDSFNFSSSVSGVLSDVRSAASALGDASDDANIALDALSYALLNASSITVTAANMPAAMTSIDLTLTALPDSTSFDASNDATCSIALTGSPQLSKLVAFYDINKGGENDGTNGLNIMTALSGTTVGTSSYQCTDDVCVDCTNTYVCSIVTNALAPSANSYTMLTLTGATMSGTNAVFNTGTAVCQAIDMNNAVVGYVTTMDTESSTINTIATGVDDIKTACDDQDAYGDYITGNLTLAANITGGTGNGTITGAVDDVLDAIYAVPDATDCGFIGDWYTNTFQGSLCTDINDGLQNFFAPLLLNALILMLCFMWIGCWSPYMRLSRNLNAQGTEIDLSKPTTVPPQVLYKMEAPPGAVTMEMANMRTMVVHSDERMV